MRTTLYKYNSPLNEYMSIIPYDISEQKTIPTGMTFLTIRNSLEI